MFVVRDPFRYSEAVLCVPQPLGPALACFNGEDDKKELQRVMSRVLGRPALETEVEQLFETLRVHGFLEGAEFEALRTTRHRAFAEADTREPAHAGGGYPEEALEIDRTLDGYYKDHGAERVTSAGASIGIAAPHVSPFAGPGSYAQAYARIAAAHAEKTFVILGTSHYGPPDRFGLTKKTFLSPYGRAEVDQGAVDFLSARAPGAVTMEDYCHAIEHSIEFQLVFLQHAIKAPIRILPILCGPFSCGSGGSPEDRPEVAKFFAALRALAESRDDLFWVLGIDLAHIGKRYGHAYAVTAERGRMTQIAARDRARLARVCEGDASGFFELAHSADDELNWCGTPPLYSFLRAVPEARASVLRYEQWNIDPQSVVTFAGLELTRR